MANPFKLGSKLIKNDGDGSYIWIIDSSYPIEFITL
jgi:hypothetical protein